MTKLFRDELEKIKKKILSLSSLVEESVEKAVLSLVKNDRSLAEEVIENDHLIDTLEVEVEEDCLKVMALYQPVAIDLRFLVAVLKINNDLERIADISANIADRCIYLFKEAELKMPFDLEGMADKTRNMLKKSLSSLIEQDVDMANEVIREDDEIDEINRKVYLEVYRQIKKDPSMTEALSRCGAIAKFLERISDYSTNIAEDVIYMVDAKIVRHKPESLL